MTNAKKLEALFLLEQLLESYETGKPEGDEAAIKNAFAILDRQLARAQKRQAAVEARKAAKAAAAKPAKASA
jgi:hypothetical protein